MTDMPDPLDEVIANSPRLVTRDSELWVQEEDVEDLLNALKGELRARNFGDAVRLEVSETCPPEMSDFLLQKFGLHNDDLYRVDGPVNLHRLATLYDTICAISGTRAISAASMRVASATASSTRASGARVVWMTRSPSSSCGVSSVPARANSTPAPTTDASASPITTGRRRVAIGKSRP